MNLQPTLEGHLITLRPLLDSDFIELFQCASDPLIWEQHPQQDRFKRSVFESYFSTIRNSGGALAIIDRKTGALIGSSTYYEFDATKKSLVIGYTFLKRDYWGGKFNGEVKWRMIDHAFQTVDTVFFEIGINNLRSRRAIEKIGAVLVREANYDKKPHAVYAINKNQWKKL